jgi:hypothetical protein
MFKIIDNPEFTHDVTVMVPVDGGHEEQTFKARYRILSDEDQDGFDVSTTDGLKGFLKKTLVALDDLAGSDDKPIEYNDAVRDHILSLPYARLALLRTYMTAVTKARAGN